VFKWLLQRVYGAAVYTRLSCACL